MAYGVHVDDSVNQNGRLDLFREIVEKIHTCS